MALVKSLLLFLVSLIKMVFHPVIFLPLVVVFLVFVKEYKEYREGAYYQITKNAFWGLRNDVGRYGEYLTYKRLRYMEKAGARFLFNVYIPKANGETSEIDVLMICAKGIFVFESKNYSGWIFGSETQKTWYQTQPAGRGNSHKERFYNPIMQNRSHIKHLKHFLGEEIPMHSIIVFSERCTLKGVEAPGDDAIVINRDNVASSVSGVWNQIPTEVLDSDSIAAIYQKLYPLTQVSENEKAQHIAAIHQEKCPYCHGDLVLRTAAKEAHAGKRFYGCANFPKCKFTKSVTDSFDESE